MAGEWPSLWQPLQSVISPRLLGCLLRAHTNLKLVSKGSAHGGMLAKKEPATFMGL